MVLDIKIDEAQVYIAKLRIEMFHKYNSVALLKQEEELAKLPENLAKTQMFIMAMKYAQGQYKEKLQQMKNENREFCYTYCNKEVLGAEERDYKLCIQIIRSFLNEDDEERWSVILAKASILQQQYEKDMSLLKEIEVQIKALEEQKKSIKYEEKEATYRQTCQRFNSKRNQYNQDMEEIRQKKLCMESKLEKSKNAQNGMFFAWLFWILLCIVNVVGTNGNLSSNFCCFASVALIVVITITAILSQVASKNDVSQREIDNVQARIEHLDSELKSYTVNKDAVQKEYDMAQKQIQQLDTRIQTYLSQKEELICKTKSERNTNL